MRPLIAALLLAPALACAQEPLQLEAEAEFRGASVVVKARAKGAPDGTRLRIQLSLRKSTLKAYGDVRKGKTTVTFGPAKKVLPGTYAVKVDLERRVQRRSVSSALRGRKVAVGKTELQVGDPKTVEAEVAKVQRKFARLLQALGEIRGALVMWGSVRIGESGQAKILYRGDLPGKVQRALKRQWTEFSDELSGVLETVRHDYLEFSDYTLINYFGPVSELIGELLTTIERAQDAYTLAILSNLNLEPSRQSRVKGAFALKNLIPRMPALAERAYKLLDLPKPQTWDLVDIQKPETSKDIVGDLFRSTVSKFEVKKPGADWMFETSPPVPRMRIRMKPQGKEPTTVAIGVEIRDHPTSESYRDLAQLDQQLTRNRWPGFELIRSKRLTIPDGTMPKGVRHGEELRYRTKGKDEAFFVLQYTLFCRWHKRAYSLICLAPEVTHKKRVETFEDVCATFKVLDDPRIKDEEAKEEKR